jgi:hypothetical protein
VAAVPGDVSPTPIIIIKERLVPHSGCAIAYGKCYVRRLGGAQSRNECCGRKKFVACVWNRALVVQSLILLLNYPSNTSIIYLPSVLYRKSKNLTNNGGSDMCKSVHVAPFDIPNQSGNLDVGAGDLQ